MKRIKKLYSVHSYLILATLLLFVMSLPSAVQGQEPTTGTATPVAAGQSGKYKVYVPMVFSTVKPQVISFDLAGKKVTLDPGHGWLSDPGASANGMKEKDITLDIANKIKPLLEQYGIQVTMTRTGDEPGAALSAAAQRANQYNADIVVAIHVNAGGGTGTESCNIVNKATSTESWRLGGLMTSEVSSQLSLSNRGNFAENDGGRCARSNVTGWTQLYIHDMNPVASLIETAFIDSPQADVDKLRNRRQDFAKAISDAIVKYFGGTPGQQQPVYNTAFLTDAQLADYGSMSATEIRNFLASKNSYFAAQSIQDADGQTFDPAQVIVEAANQYQINPKVILATLQKENSGVTRSDRPNNMAFLMGCKSSTTARDQLKCTAERFRAYNDQLNANGQTVSGWKVGVAKTTQDGVSVTPATKAVAGQFTYTPYAGVQWSGNQASVGGVYLFYKSWQDFGFDCTSGCPWQGNSGSSIVLEEPTLTPGTNGSDTCTTYWYRFANNRGHSAYLTMNTNQPSQSTNRGEWRPNLVQGGVYKLEAYIADRNAVTWPCSPSLTLGDTTNAHYVINHASGSTTVTGNQLPLANQWLDLGSYSFNAGTGGVVTLADLNNEANLSSYVSFSAMRFTCISGACKGDTTPTAPSDPSNLQVNNVSPNSLTLTWQDTSNNETSFKIYRWDGTIGAFLYLTSVGANATSFTDAALNCGWDYFYEVSAYNTTGESNKIGWVQGTVTNCGTGWTSWQKNGATLSPVVMEVFNSRLYQVVRGSDNGIYTRNTIDGSNWSGWVGNGATPDMVEMTIFNNRLYQAVRGTDNGIYTRYTVDGSNWSGWVGNGATPGTVRMMVFNGRLYQAVRGTDDGIYTRYTIDGANWSGWVRNGATLGQLVEMMVFNGRLYQTVRGTDNGIYTRYTTDGDNWSGWNSNGSTYNVIKMMVFNGRLYQAVRGTDNGIYTRYTIDGDNWSGWSGNGYATDTVEMTVFGDTGRLYQAVKGTDNGVYTRYTTDGSNWLGWERSGDTKTSIRMKVFNPGSGSKLYQAIRGTDDGIYTRYLGATSLRSASLPEPLKIPASVYPPLVTRDK